MTTRLRTRLLALAATTAVTTGLAVGLAAPAQAEPCPPDGCMDVSGLGKMWALVVPLSSLDQRAAASGPLTTALDLAGQGAPEPAVLAALQQVAQVLAPLDVTIGATVPGLDGTAGAFTDAVKLLEAAKL